MSEVLINGSELKLGMVVKRVIDGKYVSDMEMIVYADGPYYNNSLYKDDLFLVYNYREVYSEEN